MVILLLFVAVVTPYRVAFGVDAQGKGQRFEAVVDIYFIAGLLWHILLLCL